MSAIDQYVQTLERAVENRAVPDVTTISPHFEHRVVTPAEKQALREKHLNDCKKWNSALIKHKQKVQYDSKGASVLRSGFHIDHSKSLYQPPDVICTGQVKNIIQVYPEKKGPRRGHWAIDRFGRPIYKNGRRLWIDGQHNYNRQLDPRNPDKAVLGTRLMNQNFELKKCLDPVTKKPITEIDDSARIVTLGLQRRVYDRASQTEIFDEAAKKAAEIIRNSNSDVTSASYQTGAQAGEHPESHK